MSNSGRRKYNNKDNPRPEDFGRREDDGDMIIDKQKLYDLICEIKEDISGLNTTVNNGIVDAVDRLSEHTSDNSQKIEQLKEKIQKMDKKVENHSSYSEGGKDRTKKIIAWGVGVGGWLIAILTFLFGSGIL